MSRAERLVRALAAATLSTGVALAMHLAGGGHAIEPQGFVLPWAVALVVCVQLAGVVLSRWRLAVAVASGQIAFHSLFSIGTASAGTAVVSLNAGDASQSHAAHVLGAGALAVQSGPAGHVAHQLLAPMIAAHLLAGALTYLVLRKADLIVEVCSRLVQALVSRLSLPRIAGPILAQRASAIAGPSRSLAPRRHWSTRIERGPPALLA